MLVGVSDGERLRNGLGIQPGPGIRARLNPNRKLFLFTLSSVFRVDPEQSHDETIQVERPPYVCLWSSTFLQARQIDQAGLTRLWVSLSRYIQFREFVLSFGQMASHGDTCVLVAIVL
jgi:hypothetical protein